MVKRRLKFSNHYKNVLKRSTNLINTSHCHEDQENNNSEENNAGNTKEKIILLELDNEHLLTALTQGTLQIKGRPEDSLVICTQSQTFMCKQVHTSNSTMVIRQNEEEEGYGGDLEIDDIAEGWVETRRIPGRIEPIISLLNAHVYEPDQEQPSLDASIMLSPRSLFTHQQASDQEIVKVLKDQGALQLEDSGHYQKIGPEYTCMLLKLLWEWLSVKSEEFPLDQVTTTTTTPLAISMKSLQKWARDYSLDPSHVLASLRPLSTISDNSGSSDDQIVCLQKDAICKFFANQILSERPSWQWKQFQACWQSLVHPHFTPTLSMLDGIALTTPQHGNGEDGHVIEYFPAHKLPLDASKRISLMFARQARWPYNLFLEYVKECALVVGVKPVDLIMKHVRISGGVGGGKVVTALINEQM